MLNPIVLSLCLLSLLPACHRGRPAATSPPSAPLDIVLPTVGCSTAAECERACEAGRAAPCVEAGRLYEYGHAGGPNPTRAFALYDRSCGLGSAAGCFNAALLLETGRGVPKETRQAVALYQKTCLMGSRTACRRAEDLSSSR
jgi:TPR repeat protein